MGGSLLVLLFCATPHNKFTTEARLLSSDLLRGRFPWGVLLVHGAGTCLSGVFQVSLMSSTAVGSLLVTGTYVVLEFTAA